MSNTRKFNGPIKVGTASGDPSDNESGIVYFNSTLDVLKFKASAIWKTVLGALIDDSNPQLGGNLDLNGNRVLNTSGDILVSGANSFKRSKTASPNNFIEEEYVHSVMLLSNVSSLVIPELTFDTLKYEGCKIDYKLRDDNGEVRVGTIVVATNGTSVSVFDGPSTETATTNITFNASILPIIGSIAAQGTLNTTTPIILTSILGGSYRNTDTFTLQVLPAAPNTSDEVYVDFTGTTPAIVCTVTPNDGTNVNPIPAVAVLNTTTNIVLESVAAGPSRNGETFTLQVNAAAANPTDTILVNFTGTAPAIVCTVTPNDGTNNSGTPVNLTTEELVELINSGSVIGKNITLTDLSTLRILQTATGGDSTDLADGGEGDGLLGTFSGGAIAGSQIDLTTEELVELINSGSVIGKNIVITGNSLRVQQTASGGDTTNLADGGEGDGLVATFSSGVDGTNAACLNYTSGSENAEIRLDIKKILK